MSVTVEIAFNVVIGAVPDEEDWVDVTEDLEVTDGQVAVRFTSGRISEGDSLRPGVCEFSLISHAGKYSPRNTDGPYFAQLVNGLPVRVLIGGATGQAVRWTGTLRSGWPMEFTVGTDVVIPMEAHDNLGQAASTPMPVTSWDWLAERIGGTSWWRCGIDGWICRATERRARHTSGLVEAEALVDGGDKPWKSADIGEGVGVNEAAPFIQLEGLNGFAVSMFVKLDRPETTDRYVTLLQQSDAEGFTQLRIQFDPLLNKAHISLADTVTGGFVWVTPYDERVNILDGRFHHVLVDGGFDIDVDSVHYDYLCRLFIDGTEVPLTVYEDGELPVTGAAAKLYLGGGRRRWIEDPLLNATGIVDHIYVLDGTMLVPLEETPQLARQFTALARLANAGQRLDERFRHLVTISGLEGILGGISGDSAWIGTTDESGIRTSQGYRHGELLALLTQVEETEQGRISCGADGKLNFSARGWAWNDTRATTVQATFSDVPSELVGGAFEMMIAGTAIEETTEGVVNRAEVTSVNGRTQHAADYASMLTYGTREPQTLSGLLHSSDRSSLSIAQWLVLSQSDARVRVSQLTFDPSTDEDLQAFAETVAEGDLVRVIKAPALDCADADVGDPVTVDGHVIGVEFNCTPRQTLVTLTLDTTRIGYSWFKWGESEWGGTEGWAF